MKIERKFTTAAAGAYGEMAFQITASEIRNPDGKVVKALPAGDDENSKDSKKAFTAAKKELGQIVTLQGERLFEAMCVERQWPVTDWRLAFHQHPVMRRLIERLVWQGLDAEGQPLGLFRPTQEGDFTDAGDSDVAIDDFAAVRLAHGALVDAETGVLTDTAAMPALNQALMLSKPLHFGDYGGLPLKLLWAALTLSLLEPSVQACVYFFHERAWARRGAG